MSSAVGWMVVEGGGSAVAPNAAIDAATDARPLLTLECVAVRQFSEGDQIRVATFVTYHHGIEDDSAPGGGGSGVAATHAAASLTHLRFNRRCKHCHTSCRLDVSSPSLSTTMRSAGPASSSSPGGVVPYLSVSCEWEAVGLGVATAAAALPNLTI